MIQSCCGWLALALHLTMKIFLLLVIALCWGLPGDTEKDGENEERNYDEYSPGDTEKDDENVERNDGEYLDQNEDESEEYKEAYSLG